MDSFPEDISGKNFDKQKRKREEEEKQKRIKRELRERFTKKIRWRFKKGKNDVILEFPPEASSQTKREITTELNERFPGKVEKWYQEQYIPFYFWDDPFVLKFRITF